MPEILASKKYRVKKYSEHEWGLPEVDYGIVDGNALESILYNAAEVDEDVVYEEVAGDD